MVLTFLGHYLPGWRTGGPVRSLANLVERLGDQIEFRIVTFDRDLDGARYEGVEPDRWLPVGKALVRYVRPSIWLPLHVAWIVRRTQYDVLYLNGYFDRTFSLPAYLSRRRAAGRPSCIIAPRGEFSPGALELKSRRKRMHLRLFRAARRRGQVRWHAASAHEATDIRRVFGPDADIVVAENPTVVVGSAEAPDRVRGQAPSPLRVLFLSRITPKKNLDMALEVLGRVRCEVDLRIVGAIDDQAYWERCRRRIAALPPHVKVAYEGSKPHEQILRELPTFDLSFLPTRGENFGHSIVEALAAGVPVLISDQTPWRGLAAARAGWDLALADPGAYVAAIEEMAGLTIEERQERSRNAVDYARSAVRHEAAIAQSLKLFTSAVSRGS